MEWYRHLRAIDEPGRADAIMMSTMRSVERCVADAVGPQEYDPGLWKTVDTFVQQRFGTHRRAGSWSTTCPARAAVGPQIALSRF